MQPPAQHIVAPLQFVGIDRQMLLKSEEGEIVRHRALQRVAELAEQRCRLGLLFGRLAAAPAGVVGNVKTHTCLLVSDCIRISPRRGTRAAAMSRTTCRNRSSSSRADSRI